MVFPEVIFVGQAPPEHEVTLPFGRTLLYKWLATIDISPEEAQRRFAFTALIDFFPGKHGRSHRAPTPEEIEASHPRLRQLIIQSQPAAIVTVGALSARTLLQQAKLPLDQAVGRRYIVHPWGDAALPERVIIPFPHPSGASSWIYQHNHQELLAQALHHLHTELQKSSSS